MTKKKKQEKEIITFPDKYIVVGGDISLKRPGFAMMYVEKENGIATIKDLKTTSTDNKKDTKKCHGELLNDILRTMAFFFPDEEKINIPVYYVKEKYINATSSMNEQNVAKAVGISDWLLFHMNHEWTNIYPTTIKKLVTGNGKATKEDVALALHFYVGDREYANDDESDAVAVCIAFLIQNNEIKQIIEEGNENAK